MKCPHCKEEIDGVHVYHVSQLYYDLDGMVVGEAETSSDDFVDEINCPECHGSLVDYVKHDFDMVL